MAAKHETESQVLEREIITTRVFDAPRELVWQAWTDPAHLPKWWGPNGFTTTIHSIDVRPGGDWRFTMHGPDGTDYPSQHAYLEVVKPERLLYDVGTGEGPPEFRATVTFTEIEGRTKVELRCTLPSAAALEAVRKFGAIEGGQQTLARCVAVLAELGGAGPSFSTTRVFAAPRRLVFAAWSSAEHLTQWLGPDGFTMPSCEVDFRAGGVFRFVFRGPAGDHGFEGAFREVVPDERIVYAGRVHGLDVVTTLTFSEQDGKTRLTVLQSFSEEGPATRGAPIGWGQSLDHLEAFVAARL